MLLGDVVAAYKAKGPQELTLEVGDVVEILDQDSVTGWLQGKRRGGNGKAGAFPSDVVVVRGDVQALGLEIAKFVSPVIVGLPDEPMNSTTRFGMWASNMTIGSAVGLFSSGTVSFYWLVGNAPLFTPLHLIIGIYAMIVGFVISVYECRWTRRAPTNFPARAVAYTLLAIPAIFSIATLVPAALLVLSACAHLLSALKSETFVQEQKKRTVKPNLLADISLWDRFRLIIRKENRQGEVFWILLGFGINLYIFFSVLAEWFNMIDGTFAANFGPSQFVAWAKAWGGILDLNCALILIPVCRTFIRTLYDLSTQSQTRSQRILRRILALFPLDRALSLHKMIAWLIMFAAVMHTIAHLVNYGLAPDYTWQFYGPWPWTTGVGLFICMLFMYGAVPYNVKWVHFELFWFSHHFFVPFFILLIPHGRGGFNRVVWKYLIGPIAIYLLERVYRAASAYRTVALTGITHMESVIAIEFNRKTAFPNGYREGQYLYLNAPHISSGEWHPFTISSAPQEEMVTLHIRAMQPEQGMSWTARLADYCVMMMPPRSAFYSFVKTNDGRGKVYGADGKKLFRVYGPHSAPTQHVSEYSIAMVIGAGIGITPVCATMKSIVHYRWKFNIGISYPDHVYFYFVIAHKELDSFRWAMRFLKAADDEIHNLWAVDEESKLHKTIEFHIYITSVPDKLAPMAPIEVVNDEAFWGRRLHGQENLITVKAPWTEMDLLMALKNPDEGLMELGNVRIRKGRPQFAQQFERIAERHIANDIGVAYCGNPFIAKDLRAQCTRYSSINSKTFFRLHKEEF